MNGENRINYLDGDRILHQTVYTANGSKTIEFKLSSCGQLEAMKQFDEDGSVFFEVDTTYQDVAP